MYSAGSAQDPCLLGVRPLGRSGRNFGPHVVRISDRFGPWKGQRRFFHPDIHEGLLGGRFYIRTRFAGIEPILSACSALSTLYSLRASSTPLSLILSSPSLPFLCEFLIRSFWQGGLVPYMFPTRLSCGIRLCKYLRRVYSAL